MQIRFMVHWSIQRPRHSWNIYHSVHEEWDTAYNYKASSIYTAYKLTRHGQRRVWRVGRSQPGQNVWDHRTACQLMTFRFGILRRENANSWMLLWCRRNLPALPIQRRREISDVTRRSNQISRVKSTLGYGWRYGCTHQPRYMVKKNLASKRRTTTVHHRCKESLWL